MRVIDSFSKRAWAIPIRKMSGKEMLKAFQHLFMDAHPRKLNRLKTDGGKVFMNKEMLGFLRGEGMHHFLSYSDHKIALVEGSNAHSIRALGQSSLPSRHAPTSPSSERMTTLCGPPCSSIQNSLQRSRPGFILGNSRLICVSLPSAVAYIRGRRVFVMDTPISSIAVPDASSFVRSPWSQVLKSPRYANVRALSNVETQPSTHYLEF